MEIRAARSARHYRTPPHPPQVARAIVPFPCAPPSTRPPILVSPRAAAPNALLHARASAADTRRHRRRLIVPTRPSLRDSARPGSPDSPAPPWQTRAAAVFAASAADARRRRLRAPSAAGPVPSPPRVGRRVLPPRRRLRLPRPQLALIRAGFFLSSTSASTTPRERRLLHLLCVSLTPPWSVSPRLCCLRNPSRRHPAPPARRPHTHTHGAHRTRPRSRPRRLHGVPPGYRGYFFLEQNVPFLLKLLTSCDSDKLMGK
ncbi:hypothetical protein U9M48_031033 [Paspalum notatum var. saurae]|uniref:Uncharacterized protein n=1 Tax=Paspalum notatum var. saurae TaxID=547442 RepID=A0AAQ3U1U5_PASNO